MNLHKEQYKFELNKILLSYYYKLTTKEDLSLQIKVLESNIRILEENTLDTVFIRVKTPKGTYINLVSSEMESKGYAYYHPQRGIPLKFLYTHSFFDLKALIDKLFFKKEYEYALFLNEELPF